LSTEFIRGLQNYRPVAGKRTVATLGTFDGIHRGHQEILRRVRLAATNLGVRPVLITFHPHPRVIVSPDDAPGLLTTTEEKERFIPHFFEGCVLVLDFDDTLKNMCAEDFVKEVLVEKIRIMKLIVGYDHGFGKNREGSTSILQVLSKTHAFEVEVVDPVFCGGRPVSSSRIRKTMANCKYAEALDLLGHDYAIFGTVERGIGLGHKIGYPTVNVKYGHRKLLPPQGVYACWAQVEGQEINGMMFIGQNHFNSVPTITVEANLFGFDRDIYGQEIIVYPTHYIRENRKFSSTSSLAEQIQIDKNQVLEIISKGEKQCL